MKQKTAIIIGAGPAGLTAAYELLKRTDIHPIVFEATEMVGGIARTVNYKGNRMDVGGHRFFSKSDRIMSWWLSILPLQRSDVFSADRIEDYPKSILNTAELQDGLQRPDPDHTDRVMLVRSRLSRILFRRKFFDYPLTLSLTTLRKLGFMSVARIAFSYVQASLFPIKPENSLEDFFINRFGKELYNTFFKDYTEKVWGISCSKIKPDWGAQRIKGLSVWAVISHAVKSIFWKRKNIAQKKTETSLIEYYLYPKYGPGQMWEEVTKKIREYGGEVHLNHAAVGFEELNKQITRVRVRDEETGQEQSFSADYVFSTMPVRELVLGMRGDVPEDVKTVAAQLCYRDFITVGLLFSRLKTPTGKLPDNWIYVQESDVKLGRIQVFNNWSPFLVKDPQTIWLGLEYFCQEGDDLWNMEEKDLIDLGIHELTSLGLAERTDFLDGKVLKMQKAYPAYFGGYEQFHRIRNYLDQFENLFLIGRNGMHKYNNQDHSMLAAMTAVDNIIHGIKSKENLWKVNTETDYHEEK